MNNYYILFTNRWLSQWLFTLIIYFFTIIIDNYSMLSPFFGCPCSAKRIWLWVLGFSPRVRLIGEGDFPITGWCLLGIMNESIIERLGIDSKWGWLMFIDVYWGWFWMAQLAQTQPFCDSIALAKHGSEVASDLHVQWLLGGSSHLLSRLYPWFLQWDK